MKKCLSMLLVLTLSLGWLLAVPAMASETYGDLYYTCSDGQISITNCNRSAQGELTIPDQINGYPVTQIAEDAFFNCDQLTRIVIPESVTYIGANAFWGCTGLTGIEIPKNVSLMEPTAFDACYDNLAGIWVDEENTWYCSDSSGVVYTKDMSTLFHAPGGLKGEYCVPEGVRAVGANAFFGCKRLKSVTLPESVTSIGDSAFFYCLRLTQVDIPEGVTAIGASAFDKCGKLASITLPEGLCCIKAKTFNICLSLTEVTIPASVTEIEDDAFWGCTDLETIWFCGNAPVIGEVFGSGSPATAYYPGNNPTWTEEKLQNYGGELTWVPYQPVGVSVSGSVSSFADTEVSVSLWKEGAAEATYTATVSDGSYNFQSVEPGNYVLKITAEGGADRSYPLEVDTQEIQQDVKLHQKGDINGDGRVNVGDVAKIYAHSKRSSLLEDEYQLLCADYNGDGRINVGDAAKVYALIKSK